MPFDKKQFGADCKYVYTPPKPAVDKDAIILELNEQVDELFQENIELRAQNNRFETQRDELLDENEELKRQLAQVTHELMLALTQSAPSVNKA